MAGITDTAEQRMLDWVNGVGNPTRPRTPLQVRLMTANGSNSAPGTEVTGGAYAPQSVMFSAASSGSATHSADIIFTGMPACTVVGAEIWDAGGARLWYGAAVAAKSLNAGDTYTIAAGNLTVSLD